MAKDTLTADQLFPVKPEEGRDFFRPRVPKLSIGGISAKVDTSGKYHGSWVLLGDEYKADLISISPNEALALRDWLNKVLP